jgi:hypothetical protein
MTDTTDAEYVLGVTWSRHDDKVRAMRERLEELITTPEQIKWFGEMIVEQSRTGRVQ